MKRYIRILALILIISVFTSINIKASSSSNAWYIIKNGESTPSFPEEAKMVNEYGGYFRLKQIFGSETKTVIEELNEALAA